MIDYALPFSDDDTDDLTIYSTSSTKKKHHKDSSVGLLFWLVSLWTAERVVFSFYEVMMYIFLVSLGNTVPFHPFLSIG